MTRFKDFISEDVQMLKSKEEIDKWMSAQKCEKYTISDDLIVDVVSDFKLKSKIKQFPVNFGECNGYFNCSYNSLTDLKGAPREIGGSFYCRNNSLTSLSGAPREVGGGFYCFNNSLTSLKGAPREVGGGFNCYDNSLTSLKGAPREVGGDFRCSHNSLTSLKGAPREVGGDFDARKNKFTEEPDFSFINIEGEFRWK